MNYRVNRQASCLIFMPLWVACLLVLDIQLLTSRQVVTSLVQREVEKLLGGSFKVKSAEAGLGSVTVAELSCEIAGFELIRAPEAIVELDPVRQAVLSVSLLQPRLFADTRLLQKLDEAAAAAPRPVKEGQLPFMEVVGGILEFRDETFLAQAKPLLFDIGYISILQRAGLPLSVRGLIKSRLAGDWRFELTYDDRLLSATAECDDFLFGPDFYAALSPKYQHEIDRIQPAGHAAIRVRIAAERDRPLDLRISVFPKNMSLKYVMFPYRLDNVTGELEFNPKGFVIKHAVGESTGGHVFMSGVCDDYRREGSFKFDLRIDGIEVDERLLAACSPGLRGVIQALEGSGKVAVHGYVQKEAGENTDVEIPVLVRLLGCRVRPKAFPFELTGVEGVLEVRSPAVQFNRVIGRSGEATIEINGSAEIPERGLGLDLQVRGRNLPLDTKLREALSETARAGFDSFQPTGQIDVDWTVRKELFGGERHSFQALLREAEIRHHSLPLPLKELRGEVRGEVDGGRADILWHGVRCKYEACEIESNGRISEEGPDTANEIEVRAVGLPLNQKVYDALPREMSEMLVGARLGGTGNLRARLANRKSFAASIFFDSPSVRTHMASHVWTKWSRRAPPVSDHESFDVELKVSRGSIDVRVPVTEIDGYLRVSGQKLQDSAYGVLGTLDLNNVRILGKRFNRLSGSISYDHGLLSISGILGTLYDGVLTGRLSYDLTTRRYQASVRASGIELREYRQDTEGFSQKSISGRLTISIPDLRGVAGDTASITGAGDLDLWDADLWEVPIFLKLFTLDPTKWGNKEKFNAGLVRFELKDGLIRINSIVFKSEDAYLYGRGSIDLDGKLDVMMKVETKILGDFWLFRPVDFIFNSLQAAFLGVEVKGTFDDPQVAPKMFPAGPQR